MPRRRERGNWIPGYRGYLRGGDGNVLELNSGELTELCGFTNNHQVVCFKMVSFMLHEICLIFLKKLRRPPKWNLAAPTPPFLLMWQHVRPCGREPLSSAGRGSC